MNPIGVMQLTDTLEAGGAERVAVNLANLVHRDRYRTYFCTTRRDGPLAELLASDVGRLRLDRKRRFDRRALGSLVKFIRQHRIEILHAHGTALLVAKLASLFSPHPKVVWHDHFGRYAIEERPAWLYRLLTRKVGGVLAVNEPLAAWSRERLRVPPDRVWYLPNFACHSAPAGEARELPGLPGKRVVCVANFRPQKDHPTLLQAMRIVVREEPSASLLLVGAGGDAAYSEQVRRQIRELGLSSQVCLLGERRDVAAVLRACDIGVLSSASEGLPLALLEYGLAGLAVVATRVGQCAEVMEDGQAGLLVEPGCPDQLASAILELLQSPQRRAALGVRLHRRVDERHGAEAAIRQIEDVYALVREDAPRNAARPSASQKPAPANARRHAETTR